MTTTAARPAQPARRPAASPANAANHDRAVGEALKRYWGYDNLRPLQKDAIDAGLAQQDSLVVLPTGGGKSLCYQIPPLVAGRVDVVVSPLISLMKDQVDALRSMGYPAIALHGGLSEEERRRANAEVISGKQRLVFVAPERLLTPWFLGLAERINVRAFAIDEAHCISQWGHDFRPEYRRLAALKERFPSASVHAFTATATPKVREDILRQLRLNDAKVLVGRFDRPNLVYRVIPRANLDQQVLDTLRHHKGEAVIVYCISRNDTERMAEVLRRQGVRAAAYHAGMDPASRARTQEAFAAEKLDVVVATVAFGMGIDRSNVRCVIHAAMPKSIEHYQQETGRAGRDGLEAECVLFYSPGDGRRWEMLITKSAAEAEQAQEVTAAQVALIQAMQRFASSHECRHKLLSRYFGQEYEKTNCKACDVCLGELQVAQPTRAAASDTAGWEGVDRGLFDRLRELRRKIAEERDIAAFIVFGDATLRELARIRPTTLDAFGQVRGVGERKRQELGARFVAEIASYCQQRGVRTNVAATPQPPAPAKVRNTAPTSIQKLKAFELFEAGQSVDDVIRDTGRAQSTIENYLEDFIVERKPRSVEAWVSPEVYRRVEAAAKKVGGTFLRPVFDELHEEVSFIEIRVVMRHAGLR